MNYLFILLYVLAAPLISIVNVAVGFTPPPLQDLGIDMSAFIQEKVAEMPTIVVTPPLHLLPFLSPPPAPPLASTESTVPLPLASTESTAPRALASTESTAPHTLASTESTAPHALASTESTVPRALASTESTVPLPLASTESTAPLPSTQMASNEFFCKCACCVGFNCNTTITQMFPFQNCTTTACKDRCRIRDPTNCRYCMLIGKNRAYCEAAEPAQSDAYDLYEQYLAGGPFPY